MANQPFIVTLDGPAGVGKTTLARSVAAKLGVAYLDTGAMFRTLGLKFGEEVDRTDPRVLAEEARGLRFELTGSGAETVLHCNGKAVGPEIRTEEVGMLAARVGAVPERSSSAVSVLPRLSWQKAATWEQLFFPARPTSSSWTPPPKFAPDAA